MGDRSRGGRSREQVLASRASGSGLLRHDLLFFRPTCWEVSFAYSFQGLQAMLGWDLDFRALAATHPPIEKT